VPGVAALDSAVWEDPALRAALAQRDIPEVFRRLVASGVTQRDIGQLTEIRPSEVSAIIRGRRVMGYDVLVRIADGFGVPRGWLGCADTGDLVETVTYPQAETADALEVDDDMRRRAFLAAAAAAVVGRPALGEALALDRPVTAMALPAKVGRADVAALRALTE